MGRAIQEFGTGLRCAFWLMKGGLWVAGMHCYSAFRLHSEHVQGWGIGSYPMLSQELSAMASRMGK